MLVLSQDLRTLICQPIDVVDEVEEFEKSKRKLRNEANKYFVFCENLEIEGAR
jgi:hypothetical protein